MAFLRFVDLCSLCTNRVESNDTLYAFHALEYNDQSHEKYIVIRTFLLPQARILSNQMFSPPCSCQHFTKIFSTLNVGIVEVNLTHISLWEQSELKHHIFFTLVYTWPTWMIIPTVVMLRVHTKKHKRLQSIPLLLMWYDVSSVIMR